MFWISRTKLFLIWALCVSCKAEPPKPTHPLSLPFEDHFERTQINTERQEYFYSGGNWAIIDNALISNGAQNAPLFLNLDLPQSVVIDVDVRSNSPNVDAKVEVMTDGRKHESGYIFIFGGWKNTLSCIARLDEHGKDRVCKSNTEANGYKTYHFTIALIQKGNSAQITWYVDSVKYLEFTDPKPLFGKGHNRFAFSNWQNRLFFDNLVIRQARSDDSTLFSILSQL